MKRNSADVPLKTGGYPKGVRQGTDGFRGGNAKEQSYDGKEHKEVAPNVYKEPQMPRHTAMPAPVGGGHYDQRSHGFGHTAKQRDGVLRNSGDSRAHRIGKRGK